MRMHRTLIALLMAVLVAGTVAADFKVVTQSHQDGFSMMGQTQPPKDEVHVTWVSEKKMRMDQGATTTIVQLDAMKMYLIHHDEKTYNEVGLPVDLEELMPPGMAEQMMAMMKFDVTVTPSDETKKIGEWTAKRYDLKMSSAMMSLDSVLWASTETPIDFKDYHELYSKVMSLQPGMDGMLDEMKQIDGYVVSQEGTMSMEFMGEATVGSLDVVQSIEELDAPAGTYDPPADYTRKDFDYMEMMQSR